jgi:uncharacterized protein YbbK (DUF523 family)
MKAKQPIKLGISSCLLGNNVRYDGGNKFEQYLSDAFGPFVEWTPVCPEVEAGLSVPREPMQLVADGGQTRLITFDTKRDRTEILIRWINEKIEELRRQDIRGYVFKARSPSCGVHDAEFFSASGASLGRRPGLFAEALMSCFPSLPVEDEERLRDPAVREKFISLIQLIHN